MQRKVGSLVRRFRASPLEHGICLQASVRAVELRVSGVFFSSSLTLCFSGMAASKFLAAAAACVVALSFAAEGRKSY